MVICKFKLLNWAQRLTTPPPPSFKPFCIIWGKNLLWGGVRVMREPTRADFSMLLLIVAFCFGTRSKSDPCIHFRHGTLYKNLHRRNLRLFQKTNWNSSTNRRRRTNSWRWSWNGPYRTRMTFPSPPPPTCPGACGQVWHNCFCSNQNLFGHIYFSYTCNEWGKIVFQNISSIALNISMRLSNSFKRGILCIRVH